MDAARRTAFELMRERQAKAKRAGKAIARQALLDEGLSAPEGGIAPACGGKTPPKTVAPKAER